MCSIDNDGLTEMVPISKEIVLKSDDCRKCHQKPVEVILKQTDPYCRNCFLSYATHKFRSCLGKHKLLPSGARVLVCSSGGAASTALLHLVNDGLALTTNKRLRLDPAFIHVDEQCVGSSDAENATRNACEAVLKLGYPCYYTTLEAALSPHSLVPVLYSKGCSLEDLRQQTSSAELQSQLKALLRECQSDTARESVSSSLLARCLAAAAVSLGHAWLLQGHSASRVATEILASMAEGAGAHVASRVGFVHRDPTSGVSVVRPLRELQHEELLHYLALHDLPYARQHHTNTTIRGCTHNFLTSLQKSFPSTVPTVFRTGDKLLGYCDSAPTPSRTSSTFSLPVAGADGGISVEGSGDHPSADELFESGVCELCRMVLDTNQPPASALEATVLSLKLSKTPCGSSLECNTIGENNRNETVGGDGTLEDKDSLDCEASNSAKKEGCPEPHSSRNDFNNLLCYACRITLQKLDNLALLPPDLAAKVATTAQQRQLLASYLL